MTKNTLSEKVKNTLFGTLVITTLALYTWLDYNFSQDQQKTTRDEYDAIKIDEAHKYNPNPSTTPETDNPHHFRGEQ